MFCEKCGSELREGSEFCEKCGPRIELYNKSEETNYRASSIFNQIGLWAIANRIKLIKAAIVILAVVLLSSSAIYLFEKRGPKDNEIKQYINLELDPNDFANVWSDLSYFDYRSIDIINKEKRAQDVYMVDYDAVITDDHTDISIYETLRYEKRDGEWTVVSVNERRIPEYKALDECTSEIAISSITNTIEPGLVFDIVDVESVDIESIDGIVPYDYISGDYFKETYGQAVTSDFVKVTADMAYDYNYLSITGDRYFYLFWNPMEEYWDNSLVDEISDDYLFADNYKEKWNIDGVYQTYDKSASGINYNYFFSVHNDSESESWYSLEWEKTKNGRFEEGKTLEVSLYEAEEGKSMYFNLDNKEMHVDKDSIWFDYDNEVWEIDEDTFLLNNPHNKPYFFPEWHDDLEFVFASMTKDQIERLLDVNLVADDCGTSIEGCTCYGCDYISDYIDNVYFYIDTNDSLVAVYVTNSWEYTTGMPPKYLYDYVDRGHNKEHNDYWIVVHGKDLGWDEFEGHGMINGYVYSYSNNDPHDTREEALLYYDEISIPSWKGLSL